MLFGGSLPKGLRAANGVAGGVSQCRSVATTLGVSVIRALLSVGDWMELGVFSDVSKGCRNSSGRDEEGARGTVCAGDSPEG